MWPRHINVTLGSYMAKEVPEILFTLSAHHCLSALFAAVLPLDSLAGFGLRSETACLAIVSQNRWQFPSSCSKTTWVPELTPGELTQEPSPCTTV